MPKIKEVYEYNNGSWANGTPIGADASNVDVALSDSTSTKDLQSVLGNVSVSDPSMKTQLTGKVNASGGDIKDTVVSVLDPASETDTSEDIDGTDVVVAAGESQTTMWSKFNMFRKRVSNKFSNFLISSVEDVLEPSDTKTYSQAALNSYFADVIGYKTDADVATVGSVADQLSTLNNNVTAQKVSIGTDAILYRCNNLRILCLNGYKGANNTLQIPAEDKPSISVSFPTIVRGTQNDYRLGQCTVSSADTRYIQRYYVGTYHTTSSGLSNVAATDFTYCIGVWTIEENI